MARKEEGPVIIRYISVVLLVATMAVVAAVVASAAEATEVSSTTFITVNTCSGETIDLSSEEKQVLDLHNSARRHHGRKPLCVNPILEYAARAHSQQMLDKDYFSHNSFNGETLEERLADFGYTCGVCSFWRYGENIYWGSGSYGTPDRAFKWWMNSPGHRANILNKYYREVGIGIRTGTFKTYSGTMMYTVDFGVRKY